MPFSAATDRPAHASGTFELGDGLTVHRLGFGAMRVTGEGIWGPPEDHDEAVRVLERTVELGIDFVDTADSYGPFVSEDLIAEALHPYPDGLVVATKGGLLRTGPGQWPLLGKPSYLRQAVQMSLRRLRVDRIDLYQLHRIDPEVDRTAQFDALKEFQDEGWVRLVGLSEVGVDEIKAAQGRGAHGRDGPERVQPRHAEARGRRRLLRGRGHRLHPVVPAQRREAGRRRDARRGRQRARGVAVAGGARVAPQAVAGDAPDPRHVERRAPGGEHGGGRDRHARRRVRPPRRGDARGGLTPEEGLWRTLEPV